MKTLKAYATMPKARAVLLARADKLKARGFLVYGIPRGITVRTADDSKRVFDAWIVMLKSGQIIIDDDDLSKVRGCGVLSTYPDLTPY